MVEDDEILARTYQARLALENFEVVCVTDGAKAMQRIKEEQPDLVVLDVMLPHKNGMEILAELKKDQATKETPVIIFTAIQNTSREGKALQMGAARFFSKSKTEPQRLIAAIKEILHSKARS